MLGFGLALIIVTRLVCRGLAACAITPDENGHVDIPDSWTAIGAYAFSPCPELVSVVIPASVTSIGTQV